MHKALPVIDEPVTDVRQRLRQERDSRTKLRV